MPSLLKKSLTFKALGLASLGLICLLIIGLLVFAERTLEKTLTLAGWPDSTIHHIAWSPSGTVLTNVNLPRLGLQVDKVTLYASPAALTKGRLDKIVVEGFEYKPPTSGTEKDVTFNLTETLRGLDLHFAEGVFGNGRIHLGALPVLLVSAEVFERSDDYQAIFKITTTPDQSALTLDAAGSVTFDTLTGLAKGQIDINSGQITLPQATLRRLGGWVNIETTADSALPLINAQLAAGAAEIAKIPFTDLSLSMSGDAARLQALLDAELAQSDGKGRVEIEANVTRNDATEVAELRLDINLPDLQKLNVAGLGGYLSVKGNGTLAKPTAEAYSDVAAYQQLVGQLSLAAKDLSAGASFRKLNAEADLAVSYDPAAKAIILDNNKQPLNMALTVADQPWQIDMPVLVASYKPDTKTLNVQLDKAQAQIPQVSFGNLALNIEAVLYPYPVASGTISVAEIVSTAKPAAFTPLKLAAELSALSSQPSTTGFAMTVTGQLGALMVKARGLHNSQENSGQLRARLEPLQLVQGVTTLDAFFPVSEKYLSDVYGGFGAWAALNWQRKNDAWTLTSKGQIKLENVAGAYAGDFPFTGLNSVLAFDSLTPPAFSKQQVAVGAFTAGLPLANGLLTLSLKNGHELTLHDGRMDMAGGKIIVAPFALDLNKPTGRITLGAGGLDLEKLFAVAPMEGLSASGEVDGTLPLTLTADGIVLDNGVLQSTGPGVLKYAPLQLPSFLKDDTNTHIVTLRTALANFQFSNLRMGLSGNLVGDQTVTLTIEGKNPDLYGGHPVKLNLNVEGPLQNILRYAPGNSTIPDTIEQQLEQFEENNALPE